jgi:beta-phosphoglucomutase
MKERTLEAVIFDLDGTLLDTEPIYFTAYSQTMSHLGLGKEYTFEEHHIHLLGRSEMEGATRCCGWLGGKLTPAEFMVERDKFLLDAMRAVKPCPGALEAVKAVISNGLKLAIATSSDRHLLAIKTNEHTKELLDLVPVLISATDPVMNGYRGKPDPAIYFCAASALGVSPANCMAIEDSISGMLSAKAAGMYTIGVPDPRLERAVVEAVGADLLLWEGLGEFEPDFLMR